MYEWSLLIEKIKYDQELRQGERDFHGVLWGHWMALFYNAHKGKDDAEAERKDFYRLAGEKKKKKKKVNTQKIKGVAEQILKKKHG